VETYGKLDSKFRFVIVASKRAKQILKGSKPKVKCKTRNPIRIAQIEVKDGLVEYDILKTSAQDLLDIEEQVILADAAEVHEESDGCAPAVEDDEIGEVSEVDEAADEDYDEEFPADESGDDKEPE
jgi:DNA-directed RNA polymerase omega subunit